MFGNKIIDYNDLHIMLVPVQVSDAEKMLEAIRAEPPNHLPFFKKKGKLTIQAQQGYLRDFTNNPHKTLFNIIEKKSNRIVGTIGLHEIDVANKNARMGSYIFTKKDLRKGYHEEAIIALLRYAFAEMGMYKIYEHTLRKFIGSMPSAHRNLGFKDKCTIPEMLRFGKDDFKDVAHLAINIHEWKKSEYSKAKR